MYRYVTSANYLGELLEWTGFALAAHTAAAWVFVLWTAANLIPRAAAIHHRYREEFGQAVGKRKRIIPYIESRSSHSWGYATGVSGSSSCYPEDNPCRPRLSPGSHDPDYLITINLHIPCCSHL